MQINISYDLSVSNAPLGFTSMVNQAVQFLDQNFANPITVNIQLGWGEIGGAPLPFDVTGEGGPLAGKTYTYAQVKAALAGNISSAADAMAVANLPATDPTGGGTFFIGGAEEKALGLIAANASITDGNVGFRGNVGVGVIEHELTHAMGRVAYMGDPANFSEFSVLDLFRYTAPGVLAPSAAYGAYFSIDGGKTAINTFDSTSDPGDWAGATPDAFNAFGGPNDPFTAGDFTVMDVLGYASAASGNQLIVLSATPSTVLGAAGDTIVGGSGSAVINTLAGSELVVGGSGATTVFGGPGDAIVAGAGSTYVDGSAGNMVIGVGSGGTDTLIGAISGTGTDTLRGGAAAVQIQALGRGDQVDFAAQTGNATINATAGSVQLTLGGGGATVYAAAGATVSFGTVSQYVDGTAGGARIVVGSGGTDTIIGSIASGGTALDTLGGGAASVQVQALGKGDVVDFAAQTGNATINATAGNIAVTLGAGAASVYGGAGDSIGLGSGAQYADGSGGGSKIQLGSGGAAGPTDIIIGSAEAGSGDTIVGGTSSLSYNPNLAGGDLIDLSGTTSNATINAFSAGAAQFAVADTIVAGNGADSVWGGSSDRIGVGNSTSAGGAHLFGHSTSIAGATIGFGTNDSVAGSSSARVTLGGAAGTFDAANDFFFYPNESAATNQQIVATSQSTGIGTQITLPDGTVMLLLGVTQVQLQDALAAGTLFKP